MKLSLSSTASLSPIRDVMKKGQPNRLCGLLEYPEPSPEITTGINEMSASNAIEIQITLRQRPNKNATSICSVATDQLEVACEIDKISHIAVYGFSFDGDHAWYLVWSCSHHKSGWIADDAKLVYRAFASLIMRQIALLGNTWDGLLHASPDARSKALSMTKYLSKSTYNTSANSNSCTEQADRTEDRLKKEQKLPQITCLISDSITHHNGDVWFLVGLQTDGIAEVKHNKNRHYLLSGQSGWIKSSENLLQRAG